MSQCNATAKGTNVTPGMTSRPGTSPKAHTAEQLKQLKQQTLEMSRYQALKNMHGELQLQRAYNMNLYRAYFVP